jgi:beta-alanine--pyruvate transaminase
VFVRRSIYEAFMQGPENAIELFHGYTYSSHPTACAASLATLYIYQHEGLLTRARELAPHWENALHGLKGLRNIVDVRNYGLIAGIEFASAPGRPTTRAFDAFLKCYERGLLTRTTGDVMALSPPLIIEKNQIDEIFGTIAEVVKTLE